MAEIHNAVAPVAPAPLRKVFPAQTADTQSKPGQNTPAAAPPVTSPFSSPNVTPSLVRANLVPAVVPAALTPTDPAAAVKTTLASAPVAGHPILSVVASLLSLAGLNTPAAPRNPLQGLVWGLFRRVETGLGVVPLAGTPTVGPPDPKTGAVSVTLGVTEPAGLPLTYTVTTAPTDGTVTADGPGEYTYTPNADARLAAGSSTTPLTDTFTVTATDGLAATAQTIVVPVRPERPPVAAGATVTTDKNTATTIDVLANDTDADADTITIASITQPTHGSTAVAGNSVIYTPTAGYSGPDSFTYQATDGTTQSNAATVTITVVADTGTGQVVSAPVSVAGGFDSLVFSPDGHAVLVTDGVGVGGNPNTTVTVQDATDGTGSHSVTTGGQFGSLQFSDTGDTALLTTNTIDRNTGAITGTFVSVISTATGGQVGDGVTLTGQSAHPPMVIANTGGPDVGVVFTQSGPALSSTTVTTVDLSTGNKLDSQVLNAPLSAVQYDPSTKTAYVITSVAASGPTAASTSVAIVGGDGQITPVTIPGGTFVSLTPDSDHLHAGIITNTSTGKTTLTTIDTDGTTIATVTINGAYDSVQYNADGSRTYLVAQTPTDHSPTTTLAIIDT
jgi:VCBS repeat-containing protein